MLTVLTRLELGDVQYLHLLPQINATCALNFHKVRADKPLIIHTQIISSLKHQSHKYSAQVIDWLNIGH